VRVLRDVLSRFAWEFITLLASGSEDDAAADLLGWRWRIRGCDCWEEDPLVRPTAAGQYGVQSYALFPHLNVFENVAFGLRARKIANAEVLSGE